MTVKLQEQPCQILRILLEHSGELVTRERLRHELWAGDTFVDFDRSLNTAVTKLRRALSDSAENPRFIETVPRHGYRFIAPVSGQEQPEPPIQLLVGIDVPGPSVAMSCELEAFPIPVRSRILRHNRGLQPSYAVAASLLVAVCLGAIYAKAFHRTPVLVLSPEIVRHSVVVLGFNNLTGDARHAWLSTALSDWLSAELAAGQATLQQIKQELGSDWVVIGSYATLGSSSDSNVRVDVRLQDTATAETIATVSETGPESQLFELISRAGEDLRARLDIQYITSREQTTVAATLPSDRSAARFYTEGLDKLRNYDALAAQTLLVKAIAIEPNDPLLHSALASTWSKLGHDADAIAEVKKASELSSSLPREERSLVLGRRFELSNNWKQAIETYQVLFDFYPNRIDYGLALVHAQVKGGTGRDAEETISVLRKLHPSLTDDSSIDLAEAEAADSQGI